MDKIKVGNKVCKTCVWIYKYKKDKNAKEEIYCVNVDSKMCLKKIDETDICDKYLKSKVRKKKK